MAQYHVNSHGVAALKIAGVLPLMGRNSVLVSPDQGLTLVLEDGSMHNWLAEKDSTFPSVGDFLVRDEELNVTYIVAASKFSTLFAMTEAGHDE